MSGPLVNAMRDIGATTADLDQPISWRAYLDHTDALLAAHKTLAARVKELEGRLSTTESRAMRFRGVYQAAEEYKRGDLVTLKGALWHANRSTTARPGEGAEWQLAVKSGAAS